MNKMSQLIINGVDFYRDLMENKSGNNYEVFVSRIQKKYIFLFYNKIFLRYKGMELANDVFSFSDSHHMSGLRSFLQKLRTKVNGEKETVRIKEYISCVQFLSVYFQYMDVL